MIAFLKLKKFWVLVFVAIVLLVILISRSRGNTTPADVVLIERGDVSSEVAVTGRVKSSDEVDLAFERPGKVASIRVGVGDRVRRGQLLATLSIADLLANLDRAKAMVKAEEAALSALTAGSRVEDVQISKSKYESATQTVENKRILLGNAVSTAYIKVENTFSYYIDQFFSNAHSIIPQISIPVRSEYKVVIESGRPAIEKYLTTPWSDAVNANVALLALRDYVGLVAIAINDLSSSANLSATTIDGYKSNVSVVRTTIETEIGNITSATQSYSDALLAKDLAKRQYELTFAPARPEDLLVASARLDQVNADLRSASAEVGKAEIFAPFSGIITRQDFKLGETVGVSSASISLIDDNNLDVEVNIPEADIADVLQGQKAVVDLDAYGPQTIFEAEVISIDPGETIIDGVATYKTTLHFLKIDPRVRSGMTANANILTSKHEGVLSIPSRMLVTDGDKSYIYIGTTIGNAKKIPVTIILRGSDGMVEIVGEVKEGERVVLVN